MTDGPGELTGLRVLLTGATGGVGRATARALAEAGAELLLLGRREDVLEELAAEVGGRAWPGDLETEAFFDSLAGFVAEHWSDVPDVLVNNAGVFAMAPLARTEPAVFRRHIEVNLVAPFRLVRLFLDGMIRRASGHIVTVGSVAGRMPFPGNAAYCASKYGLRGLHEVLVEELRESCVRATWIEPSAIDTPIWDALDPDSADDLPSRSRMLEPQAVATAIRFAVAQPQELSIEEIALRSNLVPGDGI